MSWLYETYNTTSAINGSIDCVRHFGAWSVSASGTEQTGPYLNRLWRNILARTAIEPSAIKRILILGFGTGGALPEFYHRFPKAHIIAVEADPVMIELGKKFNALREYAWPEVRQGTAVDVLPTLRGQFDLIVSDMFLGHVVAPDTVQPQCLHEIMRLLHPQGHLLVNAYTDANVLNAYTDSFATVERKQYGISQIGYFRPHGAGVLGDRLPDGYIPFFSCPEYLHREYDGRGRFEVVQAGSAWGVRTRLGSLALERYVGLTEPVFTRGRARVVAWDPIHPLPRHPGWLWLPGGPWRRLTGYAPLWLEKNLTEDWSELAKRELKKWQTQSDIIVRVLDPEEYCRVYATSRKEASLIRIFSEAIRRKARTHGEHLKLLGAVSTSTKKILAGIATLDVPEIGTSIHVSGFILPFARHTPANAGLIYTWLSASQRQGIRFCDFDGFYAPGDPESWKGFSRFKSQFGTRYIMYTSSLWRILR